MNSLNFFAMIYYCLWCRAEKCTHVNSTRKSIWSIWIVLQRTHSRGCVTQDNKDKKWTFYCINCHQLCIKFVVLISIRKLILMIKYNVIFFLQGLSWYVSRFALSVICHTQSHLLLSTYHYATLHWSIICGFAISYTHLNLFKKNFATFKFNSNNRHRGICVWVWLQCSRTETESLWMNGQQFDDDDDW